MTFLAILAVACCATIATLIGGTFALQLRDKLHLVLGFSAGAVLAVAFFDLLPESLRLGAPYFTPETLLAFTALGFFAYTILDQTITVHMHEEEESHHGRILTRARVGAGSLSTHSLLDGLAIGLAFQASATIGAVVTAAVLVHDFSDGINTVNLVLKNGGKRVQAFKWLITDAVAPIIGVIIAHFLHVSPALLAGILAAFGGFFLYIGASDLLPESHHAHPKLFTTFATVLGAAILYGAIHVAG